MFSIKNKKGQSIVEYAILLGVVIAALLIMQVFVKRGFQGGLKDSADRMGDQFSAGGTTTYSKRNMTVAQNIMEETNTNSSTAFGIGKLKSSTAALTGTQGKGVYSFSNRTGGTQEVNTKTATVAARNETFKWANYSETSAGNFTDPF